jgi:hypothetical protein
MEYNSDFKYDLQIGNEAENEFAALLSNSKVEVKYDIMAEHTGNVFVEFESRGNPSGIAKTQADFWVIKVAKSFITFKVDDLKDICREWYKEKGSILGGDSNTSKGVLIPITYLLK